MVVSCTRCTRHTEVFDILINNIIFTYEQSYRQYKILLWMLRFHCIFYLKFTETLDVTILVHGTHLILAIYNIKIRIFIVVYLGYTYCEGILYKQFTNIFGSYLHTSM